MTGTLICCWRASTWTKSIAWVHIILNTSVIIMMLTFLIILRSQSGGLTLPESLREAYFPGRSPSDTFTILLFCTGVGLLGSLIGLVMALILLQGVHEENVESLQAWQLFGIIELIVIVITTLMLLSNVKRCSGYGTVLSRAGIILASQGFCIWVVRTHKRETVLEIKKRNIRLNFI